MKRTIAILALATVLLSLCACRAGGSVVITESLRGSGCEIEFSKWSRREKCEMPLNAGDELQVEIVCESGEIALSIFEEGGSEAYTGNGLATGVFTVKVSETGEHVIEVSGKKATGSIAIKNLSGRLL